jgi:membrane-associated phospholipid phosphatase
MIRLLPVDWLVCGYNGLFGFVWLWNMSASRFAPAIAVAHFAGMALPWLIGRAPAQISAFRRTLREVYPLILVGAFWTELDLLRPVLALASYDTPIAALDLKVFGVHIHEIWMPSMSAVWFSELMYFSYEGYYLLVFLPPLVLAALGRHSELRDAAFRLTLVYMICFVVYAAFPVDGPHFLHEPFQGPHTEGFFYRLNALAQASGDSQGCSFPSSHVAAAVTSAYIGWKYFPRWLAVLMALEALGITLSTTYTQNHYAIDSLAGLVLAVPLQAAIVPVLYGWFARSGWMGVERSAPTNPSTSAQ